METIRPRRVFPADEVLSSRRGLAIGFIEIRRSTDHSERLRLLYQSRILWPELFLVRIVWGILGHICLIVNGERAKIMSAGKEKS